MIRSFHPIGQGAFYSEIFEDFTMVYDCGTASTTQSIKAEIDSLPETIDAVFISHFHSDHVNHLDTLLREKKVKRIFLPLLHEEDKILALIHNEVKYIKNDFVEKLINKPQNTIKSISKSKDIYVIFVKEGNEDKPNNDDATNNQKNIDDFKDGEEIENGVKITIDDLNWLFIPFNYCFKKRKYELIKNIKSSLNKNSEKFVSEFKDKWENNNNNYQQNVKNAYEKIKGSLNTNSMTLYSGPILDNTEFKLDSKFAYVEFRLNIEKNWLNHIKAGCMYFGDYDASGKTKWKQFYEKYKKYFENIGVVQIPHHGSKYNYNSEINKSPKICIISVGNVNSHGHPSSRTLRDIVNDGGFPLLVTEKQTTKVEFLIF